MGAFAVAGDVPQPTQTATPSGMINHPSISGRHIVLVGTVMEAREWLDRHSVDPLRVIVADAARRITGLNPEDVHLVLMNSYWNWRNPHHFMLKTEVSYMRSRGATLEWA